MVTVIDFNDHSCGFSAATVMQSILERLSQAKLRQTTTPFACDEKRAVSKTKIRPDDFSPSVAVVGLPTLAQR
jgi:hypothetical protein